MTPDTIKALAERLHPYAMGQIVGTIDDIQPLLREVELALDRLTSERGEADQQEAVAWRPVVDFEDKYEVSTAGDIRSLRSGKVLSKNALAGDGYVKAEFWRDNERTQTYVHRVVARAFLGEATEDMEVNHKDGNKLNNAVSNLAWVTKSENVRHAMYELGALVKPINATDISTGVVTSFPSAEEAGRQGFDASSIWACLKGHRADHGGKRWEYAAPVHPRIDAETRPSESGEKI